MIKFLRKNQQIFILFIFLYSFIAVFSVYFTRASVVFLDVPFSFPLLSGFYLKVLAHPKLTFVLIAFIWIVVTSAGFYLVRIGINYLIISQRSQFSALFFIAISSFCFRQELYSGAGIAAVFLLFILDRVIGSTDERGRSYRFLDAGLLLGIGSLFYFNLVFLLPMLWVSQIILRPLSWRELLHTLVGLIIPAIYIAAGIFLLDKSLNDSMLQVKEWFLLRKILSYDWMFLWGVGFYLLIMIIGSAFALKKFTAIKIQSRKLYQLLFFLFVNLILILLLIPSAGIELIYLIAIPSSVLLSIYFAECKSSVINSLILFLLLAFPIALNLFVALV